MNVRPLAETYSVNGLQWQVIEKTKTKAIAEKKNGPKSYEVFKIKISEAHPRSTHGFKFVEVIPNNESFGKQGWSYQNKDIAYARYNELE